MFWRYSLGGCGSLGGPNSGRNTDVILACVFFSSRRRHTRFDCDWSSDVCSSDLGGEGADAGIHADDEARTRGRGLLDDVIAHAVAFADAVRDVVLGGAAADLDGKIGRASCRERV